MIKFLKKQFHLWKWKNILRVYFRPRSFFLRKARFVFVQQLIKEGILTKRETRTIFLKKRFVYLAAIILILFFINGGVVVFADHQNVGASHPLYPFKRLGENVRLALTSGKAKPFLHRKLASRRLEEMQKETTHPKVLQQLDNDFRNEINITLNEADKNGLTKEQMKNLCASLLEKIEQRQKLLKNPESLQTWEQFEQTCSIPI